jgi:hypothetical protein
MNKYECISNENCPELEIGRVYDGEIEDEEMVNIFFDNCVGTYYVDKFKEI